MRRCRGSVVPVAAGGDLHELSVDERQPALKGGGTEIVGPRLDFDGNGLAVDDPIEIGDGELTLDALGVSQHRLAATREDVGHAIADVERSLRLAAHDDRAHGAGYRYRRA